MSEIPLTKEYFDEQFDVLTRAVKEGFDGTATTVALDQVKADLSGVKDDLSGVKDDLNGVKADLNGVKADLKEVKQQANRIEATMVTKSYLDDKLADLNGNLIVKMRKLDGHLALLEDILKARAVLSDADVARVRAEFQIFPTMA